MSGSYDYAINLKLNDNVTAALKKINKLVEQIDKKTKNIGLNKFKQHIQQANQGLNKVEGVSRDIKEVTSQLNLNKLNRQIKQVNRGLKNVESVSKEIQENIKQTGFKKAIGKLKTIQQNAKKRLDLGKLTNPISVILPEFRVGNIAELTQNLKNAQGNLRSLGIDDSGIKEITKSFYKIF